jgi:hypothetical protein
MLYESQRVAKCCACVTFTHSRAESCRIRCGSPRPQTSFHEGIHLDGGSKFRIVGKLPVPGDHDAKL